MRTWCGSWIKLCVGRASEATRSERARTSVFSAISGASFALRPVPVNKPSTTPDNPDGEQNFTITHPFHPLSGHIFPLLAQRFAWGEERVFFADPQTQQLRSLPLAWTNLALPDPFVVVAAQQTVLRWKDLQQLAQLLRQKPTHHQEAH